MCIMYNLPIHIFFLWDIHKNSLLIYFKILTIAIFFSFLITFLAYSINKFKKKSQNSLTDTYLTPTYSFFSHVEKSRVRGNTYASYGLSPYKQN